MTGDAVPCETCGGESLTVGSLCWEAQEQRGRERLSGGFTDTCEDAPARHAYDVPAFYSCESCGGECLPGARYCTPCATPTIPAAWRVSCTLCGGESLTVGSLCWACAYVSALDAGTVE